MLSFEKETLKEGVKNVVDAKYSDAYCESVLYARFGFLYGIKQIKREIKEYKESKNNC